MSACEFAPEPCCWSCPPPTMAGPASTTTRPSNFSHNFLLRQRIADHGKTTTDRQPHQQHQHVPTSSPQQLTHRVRRWLCAVPRTHPRARATDGYESNQAPRADRRGTTHPPTHQGPTMNGAAAARGRAKPALPKGEGKRRRRRRAGPRVSSQLGAPIGEVLLNGKRRDAYFKRVSAYVMQFDALFETLTARDPSRALPRPFPDPSPTLLGPFSDPSRTLPSWPSCRCARCSHTPPNSA